jgi:hypothetical protein
MSMKAVGVVFFQREKYPYRHCELLNRIIEEYKRFGNLIGVRMFCSNIRPTGWLYGIHAAQKNEHFDNATNIWSVKMTCNAMNGNYKNGNK